MSRRSKTKTEEKEEEFEYIIVDYNGITENTMVLGTLEEVKNCLEDLDSTYLASVVVFKSIRLTLKLGE